MPLVLMLTHDNTQRLRNNRFIFKIFNGLKQYSLNQNDLWLQTIITLTVRDPQCA